ncbi:hypothetical protein [Nitrospira sp. Kam-Ns4a]
MIALRTKHPAGGGRKLARRRVPLGSQAGPAPRTVTAILHRPRLIEPAESSQHTAYVRFEQAVPNDRWQMDFRGAHGPRGTVIR